MCDRAKSHLKTFWKTYIIFLTPLVFLPLPVIHQTPASKCAYAILIMAVYWMTEVIPMAVTALLPLVLMPFLGVMGAKAISLNYLKDTNVLFVGGLIIAVAVEKWNLHKRLALRVLLLVGSKPRWLLFGFMSATAFLSMWISNTATTAMMVPIAQAVLMELEGKQKSKSVKLEIEKETDVDDKNADGTFHRKTSSTLSLEGKEKGEELVTIDSSTISFNRKDTPSSVIPSTNIKFSKLCKCLTLSIAYAANVGGTATLTGTGPNLVIKGQLDTIFGSATGLNFSTWFIFSFPNMLLTLIVAWLWLQIAFFGFRYTFASCCKSTSSYGEDSVGTMIRAEYDKLGPISFAEISVLLHFIILVLLWFTRNPGFMPGWSSLFQPEFITDATAAILIVILLFIMPSQPPKIFCSKKNHHKAESVASLLDWRTVHDRVSWSVMFVLGGGFAIADACQKSGLSDLIGNALKTLAGVSPWALVLILCIVMAVFTEVTSNVATATIFLPILAQLGVSLGVNPLYFMIPTTISASFAFMLPVATPPNAIVFAYGHLRVVDMATVGVFMNIMAICILTFSINTYGYAFFNLGAFPSWAGGLQNFTTKDFNSTNINTTNLL